MTPHYSDGKIAGCPRSDQAPYADWSLLTTARDVAAKWGIETGTYLVHLFVDFAGLPGCSLDIEMDGATWYWRDQLLQLLDHRERGIAVQVILYRSVEDSMAAFVARAQEDWVVVGTHGVNVSETPDLSPLRILKELEA